MALLVTGIKNLEQNMHDMKVNINNFNDSLINFEKILSSDNLNSWFNGTTVGKNYSEKFSKILFLSKNKILPNIDLLLKETNAYLEQQSNINNNLR